MTHIDYHDLTDRQLLVLDAIKTGPPDGYATNQIAVATGLTFGQTQITLRSLLKRGLLMNFTYRGGARVWRIAPESP